MVAGSLDFGHEGSEARRRSELGAEMISWKLCSAHGLRRQHAVHMISRAEIFRLALEERAAERDRRQGICRLGRPHLLWHEC
jgi:hypothetical protein